MEAYHAFLNELVNKHTGDLSEHARVPWISYGESLGREEERQQIIDSFSPRVQWEFKGTKPWINRISKGCRLCGEGEWSCLFISGMCNARCFYCPSAQDTDDPPTTQGVSFQNPGDYAFYLKEFGFRGSSFSGGEPLLVPERVLAFLRAVREKASGVEYIWMYTNGMLADRSLFKQLADEGLNEVRFDIGATGYSLDAIAKAKGVIPVITVEIPAVPEKTDTLKKLLPSMVKKGVTNLNLHQLRLTPYNAGRMLKHSYTYLHGEHPTVLESELAALELIRYVDESDLDIGVNYCAFQYKHRFQKAGYRRKIAARAHPGKWITENGYAVTLYGTDRELDPGQRHSMVQIRNMMRKKELVELDPGSREGGFDYFRYLVFYFEGSSIAPQVSQGGPGRVPSGRPRGGEVFSYTTAPASYPVVIPRDRNRALKKMLDCGGIEIPRDPDLFRIWKHWFIEPGFRPYF